MLLFRVESSMNSSPRAVKLSVRLSAMIMSMNVWALCTAVSAQSCLKMTEPARTKRFVSLRLV